MSPRRMRSVRALPGQAVGFVALWLVAAALPVHADAVDDFVQQQMQLQHVPGAAIAVIQDSGATRLRTYGRKAVDGEPVTEDTTFEIGSVSKQMIAMGVLLLVRDGKVGLDDRLLKHIPEIPEDWQAITIRQLLTHSSGLPRETPGLQTRAQSDMATLREAMEMRLVFRPGTDQAYSNVGYSALAEVITRASGRPWPQFMRERVFAPLGMNATRTTDDAVAAASRATGHVWTAKGYEVSGSLPGLRPSGAFVSSIADMARWERALRSDVLLPAALREQMWTPVTLADGSTRPYGFGIEIGSAGPHRRLQHGGTMLGFRAAMSQYPDSGLTIFVLMNAFGSLPEKVSEWIAAQQLPGLHPVRTAGTAQPGLLDTVVGEYAVGNNVLIVECAGGLLTVTRMLGDRGMLLAALTPAGGKEFFDAASPRATWSFEEVDGQAALLTRDEQGKVTMRALRRAAAR